MLCLLRRLCGGRILRIIFLRLIPTIITASLIPVPVQRIQRIPNPKIPWPFRHPILVRSMPTLLICQQPHPKVPSTLGRTFPPHRINELWGAMTSNHISKLWGATASKCSLRASATSTSTHIRIKFQSFPSTIERHAILLRLRIRWTTSLTTIIMICPSCTHRSTP